MIDKDIEIVKELVKKIKDTFKRIHHAIAIMPRIEEKDVLAIENVLKELEIKDKMIDAIAETMALDIMYADEDKDVQTMKEKIKETYRKKVEKDEP